MARNTIVLSGDCGAAVSSAYGVRRSTLSSISAFTISQPVGTGRAEGCNIAMFGNLAE